MRFVCFQFSLSPFVWPSSSSSSAAWPCGGSSSSAAVTCHVRVPFVRRTTVLFLCRSTRYQRDFALFSLLPTGSQNHSESSEIVKIPIVSRESFCFFPALIVQSAKPAMFTSAQGESGATAEERQNNQNAGLEGEESRPESRPLLQETQPGMTKASSPLEDEDRGLGDSLPNTTSSSQTSLSGLPTASGNTPRPSPSAFRLPPVDVVRTQPVWPFFPAFFLYPDVLYVFFSRLQNDPLRHRLVPLLGKIPACRLFLPLLISLRSFLRLLICPERQLRAENCPTYRISKHLLEFSH